MFLLTKIIWPLGKRFRTRMAGSRKKKPRKAPKIISSPTPRICFVVDGQMNTEAFIKYHVIFVLQSGYLWSKIINQGKNITCSTPTRYLLSFHSLHPTISLAPSSTENHKTLPNLFYCQLSRKKSDENGYHITAILNILFPSFMGSGCERVGEFGGSFLGSRLVRVKEYWIHGKRLFSLMAFQFNNLFHAFKLV